MDICYGFKGQTYKRSRTVIKIYALVIVCLLTGATNIMALEGIETQDVCAALERHSNRYGVPSFVYVDNGTQLKALQYAKFSIRDLDAMVQDNLGMKIIVSNAKAHSERGRVERRIRVLRETMEKMGVNSSHPMTCLQWDTLFSRISNSIDNLPLALGNTSNETALGYEIITPNRLKLGRNNYRSLEGNGIDLEMSSNFTRILERNRTIYQQWYQGFIDNLHFLSLRPNKWLKSGRTPVINDIVCFVFNDSSCSKESVYWKLGRVTGVSGSKVTLKYSLKAKGNEQTVVRSMRDASIVYAVGEFLSNTLDHFNDCAKVTRPRSISSECKIILMSKVCCMMGGVSILINRAHIILITGRMDDIWIEVIKIMKMYLSRLLTKEDFRRDVKERWLAERSVESEERMRMLIPAQFPKVWGETRLSADWEYEERTEWKGEVPALLTPKVRLGVKRKKNPRPGKLKRLRMRSSRESVAESNVEEPVGLSSSQPSPGSSRDRSGFGESVSGPQQEDGCEEVVMLGEEDDVFLEAEEGRTEEVASPKRMSAVLRFSMRVVEQTLTYDERIEGSDKVSFLEEMDLELDVPWEVRMF